MVKSNLRFLDAIIISQQKYKCSFLEIEGSIIILHQYNLWGFQESQNLKNLSLKNGIIFIKNVFSIHST